MSPYYHNAQVTSMKIQFDAIKYFKIIINPISKRELQLSPKGKQNNVTLQIKLLIKG